MAASTAREIASGYAQMIDQSTPETLGQTLADAADTARLDAQALQEEADELRRDASGLQDKPGMRQAAEDFLREAASKEADARSRLGLAAAFEKRAAEAAGARATG